MFHLLRSGSIVSNNITKLIKRGKSQSRLFSKKSVTKPTNTSTITIDEDEPVRKRLKRILDSSKVNHKEEILKKETLKDAHIYCKINNLSGQEAGPLIETYMKEKFNMQKNDPSACIGDLKGLPTLANNPNQPQNLEIKISNGGKANNKFNYVQLRMNHDCNYIFTAYYLDYTNLNQTGELFVFYLNKPSIKDLIAKYGNYAHGTIKKLGKISKKDLNSNSNSKEYSLRPKYGDKCWNDLLRFRIDL